MSELEIKPKGSLPRVGKFQISLPLYPRPGAPQKILLDDKPLEGVTGVVVRADAKGYSNVTVEFNTEAAIEIVAAFIPKTTEDIHGDLDLDEVLGKLLLSNLASNGVYIAEDPDESTVDYFKLGNAFRKTIENMLAQWS